MKLQFVLLFLTFASVVSAFGGFLLPNPWAVVGLSSVRGAMLGPLTFFGSSCSGELANPFWVFQPVCST